MTQQLDSALATLAGKLGTSVDQLGPEVVKAYGAQLHAQAHLYGAASVWLLVVGAGSFVLGLVFGEDNPAPWVLCVLSAIALLFFGLAYNDAAINLAAYLGSPAGATAMYLVGK